MNGVLDARVLSRAAKPRYPTAESTAEHSELLSSAISLPHTHPGEFAARSWSITVIDRSEGCSHEVDAQYPTVANQGLLKIIADPMRLTPRRWSVLLPHPTQISQPPPVH